MFLNFDAKTVLTISSLFAVGCGGGDYLLTCDIGSENCQEAIFDSVSAFTEYTDDTPPVRTISVEQYESELRDDFADFMTDGSDAYTRGLKLMKVIPQAMESSAEARIQFLVSWIGAYYRRSTKSITVIDRSYRNVVGQELLAHEFAHAIQDAQFNLSTLPASTTDQSLAVRSVIEGDATNLAGRWIYQQLAAASDDYLIEYEREFIMNFYLDREDAWRTEALDPMETLLAVEQDFPYAFGLDFMANAYESNGLQSRPSLFSMPPESALTILFGARAFLAGNVPMTTPVELAHPAPIDGFSVTDTDTLGAIYLYAYLRRGGMSQSDAWNASLEWRGDKFEIYEYEDRVVTAWTILLDSNLAQDVTQVADALRVSGQSEQWGVVSEAGFVFVVASETPDEVPQWLSAAVGP